MTTELFIRVEADRDLQDAFKWYEQEQKGLGTRLLVSVDAVLEEIRRHPFRHAEVQPGVRRALVKRFPYGIFYSIEPNRIVVFAIMHARRNPAQWQRRVDPPA